MNDVRLIADGLKRQAIERAKAGANRVANGAPVDPRLAGQIRSDEVARDRAFDEGAKRFGSLFGESNPQIKEMMDAMRQRALGLNQAEVDSMRSRGVQGINSQMATGLRQIRGAQALSGVRGGAAIGQQLPVLTKANEARGNLEADIAKADMDRRQTGMQDYLSLLTGERTGQIGSQLGYAGLAAQDRAGAMGYLLNQDYIKSLMQGMQPLSPGDVMTPAGQATREAARRMQRPPTFQETVSAPFKALGGLFS